MSPVVVLRPDARSDGGERDHGITTSRAHLDTLDSQVCPLDPAEPTDTQIDWAEVSQRMQQADPVDLAMFAGRLPGRRDRGGGR
jgi:hypothetical protein